MSKFVVVAHAEHKAISSQKQITAGLHVTTCNLRTVLAALQTAPKSQNAPMLGLHWFHYHQDPDCWQGKSQHPSIWGPEPWGVLLTELESCQLAYRTYWSSHPDGCWSICTVNMLLWVICVITKRVWLQLWVTELVWPNICSWGPADSRASVWYSRRASRSHIVVHM